MQRRPVVNAVRYADAGALVAGKERSGTRFLAPNGPGVDAHVWMIAPEALQRSSVVRGGLKGVHQPTALQKVP